MARETKSHTLKVTRNPDGSLTLGDPQFAQPAPSPDPTKFTVPHGNDNPLYNKVQKNLLQAIPTTHRRRQSDYDAAVRTRQPAAQPPLPPSRNRGKSFFIRSAIPASVKGPETQSLVADKMVAGFRGSAPPPIARHFVSTWATSFTASAKRNIITTSFTSPTAPIPRQFSQSPEIMTDWFIREKACRLCRHSCEILSARSR